MNEIITFGRGYKCIPGIKVFVNTAKLVCDKLTIICSDLDSELLTFLKNNNVNVINTDEIACKYNVDMSLSPYTLKVIFFYLYLRHTCNSKNVYMCDIADIYFQKNLFDLIANSKPYVTSENCSIQDCRVNTTWVKVCYNEDVFGLLRTKEILNGGSILGEKNGVMSLLKEMCTDMTHIISRIGNYQNIDQASLNKVVYFDKNRYNILCEQELINLAHFENASTILEKYKVAINGRVPYIIHQYDTIKPLESFLYDQFAR